MGKASFRAVDLRRAFSEVKAAGFMVQRVEFDDGKVTLYLTGEDGVIEQRRVDEWFAKNARKVEGH